MIPDMMEIAARRERLSSTSAPPEQVDLVSALGELARDVSRPQPERAAR